MKKTKKNQPPTLTALSAPPAAAPIQPLTEPIAFDMVVRAFVPYVSGAILRTSALAPVTERLALLDDQYDRHTIMDILNELQRKCYDLGYDLFIGGANLLGPTAAPTFGELAKLIAGSAPL